MGQATCDWLLFQIAGEFGFNGLDAGEAGDEFRWQGADESPKGAKCDSPGCNPGSE